MLAARPAKRRSVSDSDVIVACTAFYTASQLVSICMQCVYFATIGQSFDWREPIGLQERLEGRSSHKGEFSVMSRSRSQGTEVTIVTGDVFTPVDRLLYSETGIKIITMLLFILGAVCFHTAKFLNGPKLSCASKLSSHWSKFHGAGMTIND